MTRRVCGKPKDPKRDRELKGGYYCGKELGHKGSHSYSMYLPSTKRR